MVCITFLFGHNHWDGDCVNMLVLIAGNTHSHEVQQRMSAKGEYYLHLIGEVSSKNCYRLKSIDWQEYWLLHLWNSDLHYQIYEPVLPKEKT